jgi:hypothetical protein
MVHTNVWARFCYSTLIAQQIIYISMIYTIDNVNIHACTGMSGHNILYNIFCQIHNKM